jgi:hypothetical protein
MGRVHRVSLSKGRVVLDVDTRYDRTVETLFDLSLHYPSEKPQRRHLAHDAVETARVVGAGGLITAWVVRRGEQTDVVQLDRHRVDDGAHEARVRVPFDREAGGVEPGVLDRAVEALLEPESVDLTGAEPVALAAPEPAEAAGPAVATAVESESRDQPDAEAALTAGDTLALAAPSEARDDGSSAPLVVGVTLGVAGVVTQAVGWGFYGSLVGLQNDYADAVAANPNPDMATTAELTALRDLDGADDAPPWLLAGGALATTASLPLWLPETDGIPWWGWASGGAGLGMATAGAVLTLQAGDCETDRFDRCTDAPLATDLGPLLLLQSASFLAVPAVIGIRALLGGPDGGGESALPRVQLELSPQRAAVVVGGKL